MNENRTKLWIILALVVVALPTAYLFRIHHRRPISIRRATVIQGAVIQSDVDPKNRLPIADVAVTAFDGVSSASTTSDASGYFNLNFEKGFWPNHPVLLSFRRPGYEPLDLRLQASPLQSDDKLHIAAMVPVAQPEHSGSNHSPSVVSNIRVRYTLNSRTQANVGSAVKTFEVVNQGNIPCDAHAPCSSDGKWKAATGSASLDAGIDNEFGNVRASCIAGPCPFTRIDSSGFIHGGRHISVSALNWSDTATFLLEAEVFHTAISSSVRESYPVVFGRDLNFTLPPTQEGVSIEADIDGAPMVFPLGPNLYLSWATCTVRTNNDQEKTTVYRCELKPGYRF
jgi:hypothetical protein